MDSDHYFINLISAEQTTLKSEYGRYESIKSDNNQIRYFMIYTMIF